MVIENIADKKLEKLNIILRLKNISLDNIVFVKNCLIDKDILVRSLAARVAGHFKIDELLPLLIDSLSTGGEKMSFPDSVATFGGKILSMLEEKLKSKTNITFRKNMAFVLGKIEVEKSKKMLMVLVRDKSSKVRRVAIVQLNRFLEKDKNKAFFRQLLNEEKDETVKFCIHKILKK
ncbi:MAG: hypothetical protein ACD_26C00068G0002 [uncultured bacterium]|nr:MAG: hypothetical protein ACD_26C00068G0002 [uncultured bacterium]